MGTSRSESYKKIKKSYTNFDTATYFTRVDRGTFEPFICRSYKNVPQKTKKQIRDSPIKQKRKVIRMRKTKGTPPKLFLKKNEKVYLRCFGFGSSRFLNKQLLIIFVRDACFLPWKQEWIEALSNLSQVVPTKAYSEKTKQQKQGRSPVNKNNKDKLYEFCTSEKQKQGYLTFGVLL